jgi:hypothetical protein
MFVLPPRGKKQPQNTNESRRPPEPDLAARWVTILCVLAIGVIAGFGGVV